MKNICFFKYYGNTLERGNSWTRGRQIFFSKTCLKYNLHLSIIFLKLCFFLILICKLNYRYFKCKWKKAPNESVQLRKWENGNWETCSSCWITEFQVSINVTALFLAELIHPFGISSTQTILLYTQTQCSFVSHTHIYKLCSALV